MVGQIGEKNSVFKQKTDTCGRGGAGEAGRGGARRGAAGRGPRCLVFPIDVLGEPDTFSFRRNCLCADMQVNKTKFEGKSISWRVLGKQNIHTS